MVSLKNFVLHADLPVSAKIASSVLYPHQRLNYKQIATIPQKIMLNNNHQFQTLLILEKYEQIWLINIYLNWSLSTGKSGSIQLPYIINPNASPHGRFWEVAGMHLDFFSLITIIVQKRGLAWFRGAQNTPKIYTDAKKNTKFYHIQVQQIISLA